MLQTAKRQKGKDKYRENLILLKAHISTRSNSFVLRRPVRQFATKYNSFVFIYIQQMVKPVPYRIAALNINKSATIKVTELCLSTCMTTSEIMFLTSYIISTRYKQTETCESLELMLVCTYILGIFLCKKKM